MIVLGIHDGHGASACLMIDGKLVAMLEEDRITRLKMDAGYPLHAIDFCLSEAGITAQEVDHVAFASTTLHAFYIGLKMNALCSVDDVIEINERYFKALLYDGIDDKSFFTELRERPKFKSIKNWKGSFENYKVLRPGITFFSAKELESHNISAKIMAKLITKITNVFIETMDRINPARFK